MYKGYILRKNLPDRKSVLAFADDLYHYLFPVVENESAYLLQHELKATSLKMTLNSLIVTCAKDNNINDNNLTEIFFEQLPAIADKLIKDAQFILDYDPAANSLEEVVLSYPGFYAIAIYRLAHLLYKLKIEILPRMMSEIAHSKTGIDINAGATIGCPFFIDHGTGIVVGETTVIGNNVKLYQGVTLGALAVRKEDAEIKRHPTIEDNVVIYAGSTILGGDTNVGHDCIIGGNTWITASVPSFSVVYHTAQTVVKDRSNFNEPINFII
ncbi:MAG: serine O-acetyltransferase [Ferruginibacter sp.]|nr:serine O-acetyltransferase [Ferruginibacter sp.]